MLELNIFSPLEQFIIIPISNLFLVFGFNKYFYILSNFTIMLIWISIFLIISNFLLTSKKKPFIDIIFIFFGFFFSFFSNILKENFTKKGFYFSVYLFFLLVFLLSANLTGMVPYSFALTSHFAITLFFSFLTFLTALFLGFQNHGFNFFSLFLPAGAPFLLTPFLIIIELISYFARLFSLAIRLFANIMSGHTLLKILAGFSWILTIQLTSLVGLVPFLVVLVITGLEIIIAFLQAYVFSVLSAIYLNEALILH
jgi:ATP synthase subunit 6